MPFEKRISQLPFIENKDEIESDWDNNFGDRKNEIVFIGQDIDEELIRSLLDECLSSNEEIISGKWKDGFEDQWPIERFCAIN